MKLRTFAVIWSIGVLGAGCQSQDPEGTTLSLKRESARSRQALYDEVELIAGAGAGEDGPVPEHAEDDEEASAPDASVEERVAEEMGWSDDSGLCGNGVLDESELCDYAILQGEGTCPEACEPEPGCPAQTLVVRGCMTHCMEHEEPSAECLAAREQQPSDQP